MLQILFILVVFCASTFLALRVGAFSGRKWTVGFLFGGIVLAVLNIPRFVPGAINSFFYRIVLGENTDAILFGVAGIISVIPCLHKLQEQRTKCLIVVFLCVSLLRSSLLPAACFQLNQNELTNLSGRVDSDGVHIQTTGYTCGPAAMATLLGAYGINDSERNIALRTRCNSYSGTRSVDLVNYINGEYGYKLKAEYRSVDDVDSLKDVEGFLIAEVRATAFTDHFVAVMEIEDNSVTIADPSVGRFRTTTETFSKEWRNKVIVVSRKEP
jgi:hypothetical protein